MLETSNQPLVIGRRPPKRKKKSPGIQEKNYGKCKVHFGVFMLNFRGLQLIRHGVGFASGKYEVLWWMTTLQDLLG